MSGAENAIEEAIAAHAKDSGWTGIMTGRVVLAATVDHNGETETSGISIVYPGGSMPWPQALGIIEAARLQMHHSFIQGEP